MSKGVDLSEILARNPQVDPQRVEKTREMLRRFRALGISQKGFALAPPFSGPRGVVRADRPVDDGRLFQSTSATEDH